jgi:hypothetical protein
VAVGIEAQTPTPTGFVRQLSRWRRHDRVDDLSMDLLLPAVDLDK